LVISLEEFLRIIGGTAALDCSSGTRIFGRAGTSSEIPSVARESICPGRKDHCVRTSGSFREELTPSEMRSFARPLKRTEKRRREPTVADEERSEEEQRRFDRMLDPFDGPASESAYPEDPVNDPTAAARS